MNDFDYGLEDFLESDQRGQVGLITNNTGRDRHGVHVAERIHSHPRLKLKVIFTPEHGFGSDAPDGEAVDSSIHPKFGVPIVSLYGKRKSPSKDDLAGIDLLVYDMQDVGVRFYTYISTLKNCLEAAAQAEIPFHLLDRPDLLGGIEVEGPELTEGFSSFVGHLPIPLRYGLTPGELGLWWNSRMEKQARVKIWKCRNWKRGQDFEELGVPWVKPSPSMHTTTTALFYPGTCLFEGTNVSEGRGTEFPFQIFGAPWVKPQKWLECMVPQLPAQIQATEVSFNPTFSKFTGEICRGIKLETGEKKLANAVKLGLIALSSLMKSHPGHVEFPSRPTLQHPFFDYLAGNAWLREGLIKGVPVNELCLRAEKEVATFKAARREFFQYE